MSGRGDARRILLIESLDSAGAAAADARAHARALESAGRAVRSVVVDLHLETEPVRSATADTPAVHGFAAGKRAVQEACATFKPDTVVVASAIPGGGPVTRWIPHGTAAVWWPSGLDGVEPSPACPKPEPAHLPAIGRAERRGSPDAAEALDWTVHEGDRPVRSRLSLWDGDYLLSPVGLAGSAGADVLHAFAAISREWDTLDLVVLADPQAEFVALARTLGIGTRVHFAGAAPREAESVWLVSSVGIVLAGEGPLSSGLVLRTLARGRPVLAHGSAGPTRAVRNWLDRHLCTLGNGEADDLSAMIEQVLERSDAVEDVIARGRSLAARHEPEVVGVRLTGALESAHSEGVRAA